MIKVDRTGHVYGRLTVVRFSHKENRISFWHVVCSCGNKAVVRGKDMKSKNTRSCGCLSGESRKTAKKHGKTYTRSYITWVNMKTRCLNLNNDRYKDYGGRGIRICKKWMLFEGFYEDMGERPEGLTLERIDNNGNYELGNCKWSNPREQANNTRTNRILKHDGLFLTVAQWEEKLSFSRGVICARLKLGWSTEKALTTPIRIQRRRK